jgi:hypothetical protein
MTNASGNVERIRDYLVGRLPEDERIAFEDRLARDPALVSEFEDSLRLRSGLRQLRAQGYFDAAAQKARTQRTRSLWYRASLAAAAVFVGASFAVVWYLNREPSLLTAVPAPRAASGIVAQFTFVATRDGGRPKLALPASGLIEFRVAPEVRSAASYRVTLIRDPQGAAAQQRVGVATGVRLGGDGYVHSYVDSSELAPGSYALRLEPGGSGALPTQVFLFLLQAPGETASP